MLVDLYSAVFTFDVVNEFEGGMAGKICGSVNAKNRYGAYTGQRFFYSGYVKTGGKYLVIAIGPIAMRFDPAMRTRAFAREGVSFGGGAVSRSVLEAALS
ncbi:hypothetical protein J7481_14950 [Labrenzia sp. R4_2]|uniref:hypothetical protein n=1 Tax=Labrenzia sp. R4_2 TaxID=2821107 RepID=UPI001AD9A67C|nr:hypothetical protein [Labrenzia sp. R4_2]MBO9420801.1 hypothetical protein [Labrenzia sp. R4_2]